MSYIPFGVLGIVAVASTFGAVQLASGQDAASQVRAGHDAIAVTNSVGVNRDAKGDRIAIPSGANVRSQTVSVSIDGAQATSILVRIPFAAASSSQRTTPTLMTPASTGRQPIACEAMVSALSEVARQLGPGRCVT